MNSINIIEVIITTESNYESNKNSLIERKDLCKGKKTNRQTDRQKKKQIYREEIELNYNATSSLNHNKSESKRNRNH